MGKILNTFLIVILFLCTLSVYSQNPYDVLGLPRGANINQVKQKFRELSKTLHPDKNHHQNAEQKYKQITSAYDQIINGDTQNYEIPRQHQQNQGWNSNGHFQYQYWTFEQGEFYSRYDEDVDWIFGKKTQKEPQKELTFKEKIYMMVRKIEKFAAKSIGFQMLLILIIFCLLNCIWCQIKSVDIPEVESEEPQKIIQDQPANIKNKASENLTRFIPQQSTNSINSLKSSANSTTSSNILLKQQVVFKKSESILKEIKQ